MTKVAVYAGSFDPITKGHMWMIEQGSMLFDELIVAIGTNPEKKGRFSVEERMSMISDSISEYVHKNQFDPFRQDRMKNIRVDSYENMYLVNYAKSQKAKYLLRGIRSPADYEYERKMMYINHDIYPGVKTIFMFPPKELAEVSSSDVMGMVGFNEWEDEVQRYVPENVLDKLRERHADKMAGLGK